MFAFPLGTLGSIALPGSKSDLISTKIFDSGFYWPTIYKDAHDFVTGVHLSNVKEKLRNVIDEMPQKTHPSLRNYLNPGALYGMGPVSVSRGNTVHTRGC
ncbi:hypothetical protein Tco_0667392 [Tanacetum coccineum]